MRRAREHAGRLRREPLTRTAALGAIPVLWLALAWGDARLLLLLVPLALAPPAAVRLRGEREDEFVL